jgi:hypothetical protein
MSTPTSSSAAASTQSLAARIDQLTQQIGQHETATKRAASTMGTVGLLALVLLSAYFFYGYVQIAELLDPNKLVPLGASMLESNLPAARQAIVKQVSDSAPAWAEQISQQARGAVPTLRTKLEDYVMEQTDVLLGQATSVTEQQFQKTIQENRDLLDRGFKELATSESLSEEVLNTLVGALEQQLQADMKSQAEIVLETLRHLSSRVKRLEVGGSTDEEEQIERRVLMLARRLQLMEADPRPIQAPVVKPLVTEKPSAADESTTDKSDDKANDEKANGEKKPEAKDDSSAKEKSGEEVK